jgi:toxin-antitoxin system PIN domain toxin
VISDLLDVNVWLSLEVEAHIHHAAAVEWFANRGESQCALCRVTQMAFLRHLTNKAIMRSEALTPAEAWQVYRETLGSPGISWLAEPAGFEDAWEKASQRSGASGSWWTDAYLAAFAMAHGVRLVTFDRDFRRYEADGLRVLVLDAVTH